jgi:triosephosphate isomerase
MKFRKVNFNPTNAKTYLENSDGVLVGTASLQHTDFLGIITASK